ncbi:MAG: rod-binding protein [Hyphomicrobium sp.]|uniref:rod-binding protein n=1 Tax=Hyphomicrobium sp. TaxID=82 RepID=UPI003D12F803
MTSELTVRPLQKTTAHEPAPLASRAPYVNKTADAAQKFEAFVLQVFIQEMMPKESEAVYGSGVSGDFWKSMMSEKIAEQVAERGSVGIADYVRAGNAVPHRPGGFNPLDVMSQLPAANGLEALVADPSNPGE